MGIDKLVKKIFKAWEVKRRKREYIFKRKPSKKNVLDIEKILYLNVRMEI